MRLPIIGVVFAAAWWSTAGVPAQTKASSGSADPTAQTVAAVAARESAESRVEPAAPHVAELPDSPGVVLLRRMERETGTGARGEAETRRQAADRKAASSAAKASDRRSAVPCGTVAATSGGASSNGDGAGGSAAGGAASAVQGRVAMGGADAAGGTASGSRVGASGSGGGAAPCPAPAANPYQRFLNSTAPIPLTPRQKGYLAVRNFIDPGNIMTILGTSAIAIGSDAHTAYGPGWKGFGENAGLSLVQDATGDFFGTFLIPSVAHEDPHYHRRPEASMARRVVHAVSRTVIAQGDDGHAMPNYATLLTYPITAEIANLYVPGVAGDGPSTVKRVLTGYATDPIDNLITEFLPDVAKRVHVRVIFVQQIVNQVAAGQPVSMF